MQPSDSPNNSFQPNQPYAAPAGDRLYPQSPRQSTIPKTLGILNIIFGVVLMLAGVGTAMQYLFMPMISGAMDAKQQQVTQAIETQQKTEIKELLEEQKAAASEDEKAVVQTQIDQVKNRPKITPPNMAGMMGMTDRRVVVWGVVNGLGGALLNLVMIISGVGLLMVKGWGRKLALWVAGLKIVRLLIGQAYYGFVCVPVIAQHMMTFMNQVGAQSGQPQTQPPFEVGAMFAGVYWAQAIGMILFGSIYPIICFVLLTRSRVKNAFADTPVNYPPASNQP